MPVPYLNIAGPSGGTVNTGGTKGWWAFAPIAYFTAISGPLAVPVAAADLVKITTAHTLAAGKVMHKVYSTLDKSKGDFETTGERDGRGLKPMFETFFPGEMPEELGTISQAMYDSHLVFVPLANGRVLQIGSADYPAEITFKYSTATLGGGVKGVTVKVETFSPFMYIYTPALAF